MTRIGPAASFVTTPGGEEIAMLPRAAYEAMVEEAGHARALAEHRSGRDPGLSAAEMRELLAAPSALAFWRRKRGLSQATIAATAGIAQNYVSDLETGKREGSPQQWLKIARALGVSMEELIDTEPEGPAPKGKKAPEAKLRWGGPGVGRVDVVRRGGKVERYDPKRHK